MFSTEYERNKSEPAKNKGNIRLKSLRTLKELVKSLVGKVAVNLPQNPLISASSSLSNQVGKKMISSKKCEKDFQ